MTPIALFEAKNRLSELIDRVQTGEVIAITRRGKVVAQLALPEGDASIERGRNAIERLLVSREGVTLGKLKSKDLIEEGRR